MNRTLYKSGGKRVLDIVGSILGLVLTAPLLAAACAAIKLTSRGPLLFRQTRVGRDGTEFQIVKLRSMDVHAPSRGPAITSSCDPRITPVGRLLRNTKIDELPQLCNVLKGDMSLVGPRPEVPVYVTRYTPAQRRVLSVRPGLTDLASIVYRNEEEILKQSGNAEQFYCDFVLPRKLELNLLYIDRLRLSYDLCLMLRTLWAVLFPKSVNSLAADC